MNRKVVLTVSIFLILTFGMALTPVSAPDGAIELYYDDNEFDGGFTVGPEGVGIQFAVKFSLPAEWTGAKILTPNPNPYLYLISRTLKILPHTILCQK